MSDLRLRGRPISERGEVGSQRSKGAENEVRSQKNEKKRMRDARRQVPS